MKKRKKKTHQPTQTIRLITKEILLTNSDRIKYAYKKGDYDKYLEVVNASFEIKIREKWITIIRYDSSHGYLHRHARVSLTNKSETTETDRVIKRGDHHKWLTWALRDLRKNFAEHRRLFFKRSKTVDNYE